MANFHLANFNIIIFLFFLLHFSDLIGRIISILTSINVKINKVVDICIEHGLFVKNYALLYSTMKILEEKDSKKEN